MGKHLAVSSLLALGLIVAVQWACGPRLNEQQVRARLVDHLRLRDDRLQIRSITRDALPVATIDYGGIPARIRFRYQEGVWVIDAAERRGRWEPADRGVAGLARELMERARARETGEVMPRYARTLKLLTGWSTLLSADCEAGLPQSSPALLNLHATWHRALFANRGGEFHNADLFLRDAWWKSLRVAYSAARVDVQSSGADLRMDTTDDVRLLYGRSPVRAGVNVCLPHFTLPAFVADALGRQDAPAAWNCADLMQALKASGQLELIPDR